MVKCWKMIFYLSFFAFDIFSFVSILLIEDGAFILEQGINGYENGTFYIFFLFTVSKFYVFKLFINKLNIEVENEDNRILFFSFSFIYFLINLIAISINPEPTRFNIFSYLPLPIRRIANYSVFGYEFLYVYCIFKERTMYVKLLYFSIFCFIQYVRLVEFGGYFAALITLILTIVIHNRQERMVAIRNHLKVLLVGLIFLIVGLGLIVYWKYSRINEQILFVNRIVLQMHVTWGAINLVEEQGTNPDLGPVISNIFTIKEFKTTPEYGLGKLMTNISGSYAVNLMEEGARFTGAYPGWLIYMFGYVPAFIINLFFTFLLVWLIKMQFYFLNTYNWFIFAVGMKLLEAPKELYGGEYGFFNIKFILGLWLFYLLTMIFGKGKNVLNKRLYFLGK